MRRRSTPYQNQPHIVTLTSRTAPSRTRHEVGLCEAMDRARAIDSARATVTTLDGDLVAEYRQGRPIA
jgi:hypothetical protein